MGRIRRAYLPVSVDKLRFSSACCMAWPNFPRHLSCNSWDFNMAKDITVIIMQAIKAKVPSQISSLLWKTFLAKDFLEEYTRI